MHDPTLAAPLLGLTFLIMIRTRPHPWTDHALLLINLAAFRGAYLSTLCRERDAHVLERQALVAWISTP